MTDILDEATQDYKEQRKIYLFKKILPYILSLTLLIVVVLSAKKWIYYKDKSLKEEKTELFYESINNESGELKLEVLRGLQKDNDTISFNSRFVAANEYLNNNKKENAYEEINYIIENSKKDLIRNLAKNWYISLKLDENNLSKNDKTKIEQLIKSVEPSEPLYYNTRILESLFNIKYQRLDKSMEVINSLLEDNNSSPNVYEQAMAIKNYLTNN